MGSMAERLTTLVTVGSEKYIAHGTGRHACDLDDLCLEAISGPIALVREIRDI